MGWHYLNHQKAASLTVRLQICEREAVERLFFFNPGEGRDGDGGGISSNVFKAHPAYELTFFFPLLVTHQPCISLCLQPVESIQGRPQLLLKEVKKK